MATKPVDKIYGILGLMSDEFRTKIVVDYSPKEEDQFWHLYVHGCRIMIENGEYTILDLAASKERHSDLPTWCADFRYLSPTNYLGDGFDAGMAVSEEDKARMPKNRSYRGRIQITLSSADWLWIGSKMLCNCRRIG